MALSVAMVIGHSPFVAGRVVRTVMVTSRSRFEKGAIAIGDNNQTVSGEGPPKWSWSTVRAA